MTKVEELVEWVAETMYRQQKLDGDPRWANVGSWRKNLYHNYAKEVLSHPDLALINRETLTNPHTTISEMLDAITPIAKALEEQT